jgi:lipid-A-disaccharide synthase
MAEAKLMFIAGEVSGDARCAGLVTALKQLCRERGQPLLKCFGAGGAKMREAGMELAVDMTQHAVIGHLDALKGYARFKRLFDQLLVLACERQPDAVVLVDFSGFNLRFAQALKRRATASWRPKVIYFISPQLWASRPGRARQMERDVDLLLSIIPFEQAWYATHAPKLRVEFVGHPLVEEYSNAERGMRSAESKPVVVLLPGSRKKEIAAHLPVMLKALKEIRAGLPVAARLHLPNEQLAELARTSLGGMTDVEIKTGDLCESLKGVAVAITKSGTVSLECALMGVPGVVIYITSPLVYYIGRRVVNVKYLAMPNLLADEPVYPELIQGAATPEAIASHALALLQSPATHKAACEKLARVVGLLGAPGASRRAGEAVLRELGLA